VLPVVKYLPTDPVWKASQRNPNPHQESTKIRLTDNFIVRLLLWLALGGVLPAMNRHPSTRWGTPC